MKTKRDSWCNPLSRPNQADLSGGAARNVRIKERGGMDQIESRSYLHGFRDGHKEGRAETEERLHRVEVALKKLIDP